MDSRSNRRNFRRATSHRRVRAGGIARCATHPAGWLLFAAYLLTGCATGAAAHNANDSALSEEVGLDAPGDAGTVPGAVLRAFDAPESGPAARFLGWAENGHLRLGFADGTWADVDPQTRQATLHTATSEHHPVLALSNQARLALVASTPPTVVRLKDHQVVLRLNQIQRVHIAGFLPGDRGIFVGEENGRVHVWQRSEQELDNSSTRDLKRVITRQAPSFSAQFSPLSQALFADSRGRLGMTARSGEVILWDLSAPEHLDTLALLPGAGRSLSASTRHLVATTVNGELRVIQTHDYQFVPWSLHARALVAAASPALPQSFLVLEESGPRFTLALRNFEADGAYRWQLSTPPGTLCGLALSPAADQVALCLNSTVYLIDPATGAPHAALHRKAGEVVWQQD